MPKNSEREALSIRMDPSLQLIMKGFKRAMGVRSVDDVYDEAVRTFISKSPELAEQVQNELCCEQSAINAAIEELRQLRFQATE